MAAQVPLAWALRAAGHEVRVATQPDVAEDITRAGLTAVPVGEPLYVAAKMNPDDSGLADELRDDAWLRVLDPGEVRPERLTPEYLHGVFAAWTPLVHRNTVPDRMIDDLVAFARDWRPDLVVWDTMTYAGPVAARASGAAHARLVFGLDLDVEVVATLNAEQLDALRPTPPNVRAVDFVPLNELLPSCAAIIHHGGAGTFLTALAHGVPQVVMPSRMWCNTARAERAQAAGVALTCPPERLTAGCARW